MAGGCGSASSSSSSTPGAAAPPRLGNGATGIDGVVELTAPVAVRILSKSLSGLGAVLVNAQGRTLYIFEPDNHSKVTCTSACAAVWLPAFLSGGTQPLAAGPVKQSLLASDPDPAGGRVITYAGWPLYTYVTERPGKPPGRHRTSTAASGT